MFVLGGGLYIALILVFPSQRLHPLARFLSWLLLLSGGQWLRIQGRPPSPAKGPYLYLFNHSSLFDVFIVAAAVRHYITGVGANKQFSWPIWGFLIKRYGVIPIKRRQLGRAIRSLDAAEEAIRKGISFILSPEGTRTLTGAMGPFKKGPFHVALHTGVTIVPVGLIGAFQAKNKNDWRLTPGVVIARFGEPILWDQYNTFSVEELRDYVKEKIAKLIQE
jgi:1-acyl-sn-glycerol-3-phosphate acyltransferase